MRVSLISFGLGILFFILNFLDWLFTMRLVKEIGYQVELNPLIRWTIKEMGDWFLLPKILMGIIISLLIITFFDKIKWFKISTIAVVSFYLSIMGIHILNIWGG